MISSPRNGAPPPHGKLTDAGDAEADSMIGRFGNVARKNWTAAVGSLALLLLVAWPGASLARPYLVAGSQDQDGDPTADDQPSPTPKGNHARSISGHQSVTNRDEAGRVTNRHVRVAWQAYLRLIARIALP